MTDADNRPAVVGQVERPVRPDPERAAFEAWAAKRWGREAHRHTSATCAEWDAWQAAAASVRERDATPDQIIELSEALQVRRILEEVKKVAAIHPAADMPTQFQAAWQQCSGLVPLRCARGARLGGGARRAGARIADIVDGIGRHLTVFEDHIAMGV